MKYDFDLSLDEHTSVGKIISQIKKGSRVLEFGPGNGRMTNYLISELDCEVAIVEFDPVLYEHVMGFAQDGFLGNIEDYTWCDHFKGKTFDYIVFADVLEHLTDSEEALRQARKFLTEQGEILITFPNVAHNSVLIDLFNNKLNWNEYGLLDRTHNSFYTESGFEALFARLDLHIVKEDYTYSQVGQNEIETSYEDLPEVTRFEFKNRPYGEVYQYFFALTKQAVEQPERATPINSNYNKQMQLAYVKAGKYEVVPYIFNNHTGENKVTTHKVPQEIDELRVVIGKLPSTARFSVVADNKLVPVKKTNADWFSEDLYVFNHIVEEPFVIFDGAHVAGKYITVTVEILNEEEFFPTESLIIQDLEDERSKNRLQRLKLDFYDAYHYNLAEVPYKKAEEYEDKIKLVIESIENNEEENQVIVRGWGFTRDKHEPLDYLLADSANDFKVAHLFRLDVNETHDLPDGEKYGFLLTVDNMQIIHDLKLLAVPKKEDVVYPFIAELPKPPKLSLYRKTRFALGAVRRQGIRGAYQNYQRQKQFESAYDEWIKVTEVDWKNQLIEETQTLAERPKISLVVPVYNVEEKWLRACVASLTHQLYDNWELCLADDASPKPHIKPLLNELADSDPRIKVVFRPKNGHISEATNSAIELATGDYIGFMDNDDVLAETALLEMVKAINEDSEREFFYTDEDKLSMSAKRFDPFFKPNWNETLLLGHNYITHFVVVKRNLLDQIGGLRSEFNGSQDYDFVLRATEAAKKIYHIPRMLYHWRTIETSVAMDPQSKEYAYVAGKNALQSALERRGLAGSVSMTENYGAYKIELDYDQTQNVSILFTSEPTDQNVIEKLVTLIDWENYEVILPPTFEGKITDAHVRFVSGDVNEQAKAAKGEYLIFLAPDLVPVKKAWLKAALNFGHLPTVGLVSGKILTEHAAILNCGVIIRPDQQTLYYEQQGVSDKTIGTYFRPTLPREIFSATEDCLGITKADFEKLNGFDLNLPPQLKGVDLSLRVAQELNKKVVFDPYFSFTSQQTERFSLPDGQFALLSAKYLPEQLHDPYTNFNQFKLWR